MVTFATDERGVSEVIGSILVFGLLMTLLALVQMQGVPAANEQVELKHSQDVQNDIGGLQEALAQTAVSGSGQSVSVAVGLQYPNRFVLMNPPPVTGSLRTDPARNITLGNARAVDAETADFLNTDSGGLGYPTQSIRYDPEYNRLEDAGTTVLETGVMYKQFRNATNVQDRGILIDGRSLTLVTVEGNLSATGMTAQTLSTVPLSSSRDATSLTTNESGESVTVSIPTNLSAETWKQSILEDQIDPPGGPNEPGRFVTDVTCSNATKSMSEPCDADVVITFEEEKPNGDNVTYDLRMAKVGVGTGHTLTGETYVTDIRGDNESVVENGTRKLVAEVRDRYNNPVSGVTLSAKIIKPAKPAAPNEDIEPRVATTGADGRADFVYEAPDDVSNTRHAKIEVSFGHNKPRPEKNRTVFEVPVVDTEGSIQQQLCESGVQEACPSPTGKIEFSNFQTQGPPEDDIDAGLVFQIENGLDDDIDITAINVEYANAPPHDLLEEDINNDGMWEREVWIEAEGGPTGYFEAGDPPNNNPIDVTAGDGDPAETMILDDSVLVESTRSATFFIYAFRVSCDLATCEKVTPDGSVTVTLTYDTSSAEGKEVSHTAEVAG